MRCQLNPDIKGPNQYYMPCQYFKPRQKLKFQNDCPSFQWAQFYPHRRLLPLSHFSHSVLTASLEVVNTLWAFCSCLLNHCCDNQLFTHAASQNRAQRICSGVYSWTECLVPRSQWKNYSVITLLRFFSSDTAHTNSSLVTVKHSLHLKSSSLIG